MVGRKSRPPRRTLSLHVHPSDARRQSSPAAAAGSRRIVQALGGAAPEPILTSSRVPTLRRMKLRSLVVAAAGAGGHLDAGPGRRDDHRARARAARPSGAWGDGRGPRPGSCGDRPPRPAARRRGGARGRRADRASRGRRDDRRAGGAARARSARGRRGAGVPPPGTPRAERPGDVAARPRRRGRALPVVPAPPGISGGLGPQPGNRGPGRCDRLRDRFVPPRPCRQGRDRPRPRQHDGRDRGRGRPRHPCRGPRMRCDRQRRRDRRRRFGLPPDPGEERPDQLERDRGPGGSRPQRGGRDQHELRRRAAEHRRAARAELRAAP